MHGSVGMSLALEPEDEEVDESATSDELLPSPSQREGTIWGGEVSGVAAGATGGGPGCATLRAMAM